MKTTVNKETFINAIINDNYNNLDRADVSVLWDWYEEFEEATGQEIELDVVAIRCDWSKDTIDNILEAYIYRGEWMGLDDYDKLELLQEYTTVLQVPNSDKVLYMEF